MDETSKGSIQQDAVEGFPVLRTNVAGIDLGSKSHWVCAPTVDGQGREVKEFGATTPELEKMAAWLKERKVVSVAMESTGVYWIPPQEVLERHGLEVVLVAARELARVPGRRKTDGWIVSGFNGCTVAVCCGDRSGPKSRSTCCALWCGTKAHWSPNGPTGFGGCRRAWTR